MLLRGARIKPVSYLLQVCSSVRTAWFYRVGWCLVVMVVGFLYAMGDKVV